MEERHFQDLFSFLVSEADFMVDKVMDLKGMSQYVDMWNLSKSLCSLSGDIQNTHVYSGL